MNPNTNSGIGIDFGTTNSVAALYNRDIRKSTPLKNDKNLPHPSVAWFLADGGIIIGDEAKHNLIGRSGIVGNHFETSIKRRLGKNINLNILGEKWAAWEVAGEIFDFLKKDARKGSDGIEIEKAIVTVPVYFDGRARRELRNAANYAGIYIKTFIHEPFAAIVGHLAHQGRQYKISDKVGQQFLVFDWGDGTLDITIVKITRGGIIELAIGGLAERAGDHFDEELVRFILAESLKKTGASIEEIAFIPGSQDRLKAQCEASKIELSSRLQSNIKLPDIYNYNGGLVDIDESIHRGGFDDIICHDVELALNEINNTLRKANINANSIDEVLLIGGSSRIPLVSEKLRAIFGNRVTLVANADTVIAEGAAIIDAYDFRPIFARSIGIKLSDGSDYEVFSAGEIASANTSKKQLNFYCTDNRDGEAKLVITDHLRDLGGSEARVNEVVSIPVNPELPAPYNHERVIIDLFLDENLILNV
jgi:molecular chaperone DnaK (HSP70)